MTKRNAAVSSDAARARFEGLFRDHHVAVVGYVRRRAPQEAVDDIVGETFLVAWRRLDCVPDEELPWLLAVARNVLATQRRGAGRRRALTLRLGHAAVGRAEPPVGDCVESAIDGRLESGAVEACVQGPRSAYVDRLGRVAAARGGACSG